MGKCIMCGKETVHRAKTHATGIPLRVYCCRPCQKKAEINSEYGQRV